MNSEFQGKTALVTGAASGIGRAVSIQLAAAGAQVVVNDLTQETAQAVVDEITAAGGAALAHGGDVGDAEQVKSAVDAAVNEFGGLHLAVNNAGIGGPQGDLTDMDLDAYRKLIDVNLNSVFYGLHYQIPQMLAAGGGSIVNVSSILGVVGEASAVPYVTAKHAVTGMTKAAALSFSERGIRINSVHPGYIDTPLLAGLPPAMMENLISRHPIGRLGTSEEVAEVIVFLLSERAAFVTGSQYLVDGDYTAQ